MTINKERTTIRLDHIAKQLQRWIDFNVKCRKDEGLESTPDTTIMTPTTWPSHGQLKVWIETLREAEAIIKEKV